MTEYEDFNCYEKTQDNKQVVCKKKEGKVSVALAELNKHMLNFLVPGQVLMIQKAENVEDMLTNDMSDLKKDVRAILQQLTYYKEDHAKMKNAAERSDEVAQSNLKLMKDLQNEFTEAKKEIIKLRRDIFLREQTGRSGLDLNQGPSQNVPNQDQSRGRGGRGRGGRGRGSYEGPKGNWGASDPTKIPHILGGNAAFDPNCSNNRFFKKPAEKTENEDLESEMTSGSHAGHVRGAPDPGMYDEEGGKDFVQPNANRRKNPLTKKEMRFNKEVIVHKVKSLKKTEYSTEEEFRKKESEIIFQLFDELTPKWLHSYGVVIDIKKDIDFHDRFLEHYEEKTYGEAPIRIRFNTIQKCEQVKRAAKRAECLSGRRESYYGKFAKPREYDKEGNHNDKLDEEAKNKASTRPKFFFRPSIPREERDKKKLQREEREEKKNHSDNLKWKDKRIEDRKNRVFYGNQRNFGKNEADVISSENMADRDKRLKDLADKKAQRDKEKRDKLTLSQTGYPGLPMSYKSLNESALSALGKLAKGTRRNSNSSFISDPGNDGTQSNIKNITLVYEDGRENGKNGKEN